MTTKERRQARYEKRVTERLSKVQGRSEDIGTFEEVFSLSHILECATECCRGLKWKGSTQMFEMHLFTEALKIYYRVREEKLRLYDLDRFTIKERGKVREIGAPRIEDRVIYKVITKYVLVPLYSPYIIDTNGACMKGKGFHYTLKKVKEHLHEHYQKYGTEGYVILWDFEKFFPSALHSVIRENHAKVIKDEKLRSFVDNLVDYYEDYRGLNLGMETSQVEMVMYPHSLDNYVRGQMHLPLFGHYMDDGYIMVGPEGGTKHAEEILDIIIEKAAEIGLTINKKKTKILPIGEPFKYCKATFNLTKDGKIYMKGNPKSATKERRRVIKLGRKLENMSDEALKSTPSERVLLKEDVRNATIPGLAYFKRYDNHNTVLSLSRLIHAKFGASFKDAREFREGDESRRAIKEHWTGKYTEFMHSNWKARLHTPVTPEEEKQVIREEVEDIRARSARIAAAEKRQQELYR